MYQCVKQFGSIKTGSFWDADRYIVNSDGERRKVIITNEDNWLLLSMTDFENHFAKANKPLTEQEWLQTADTEQLAEYILNVWLDGALNVNAEFGLNEAQIEKHKGYIVEWLKQPHTKVLKKQE